MNMTTPPDTVRRLRDFLTGQNPGQVLEVKRLEPFLAAAWDEFEGSGEEEMAGDKLFGRMEEITWEPPILQFDIERHGATAMGSTRAEVQSWQIDVSQSTASCVRSRWRQLYPMARRWNHQEDVAEIIELIVSRKEDPRLTWRDTDRVTVKITAVVPDGGAQETTTKRRRRFRDALTASLQLQDWHACKKKNNYEYRKPSAG